MKNKISITVDKDLLQEADSMISEGRFRNTSHILEYALKILLRGQSK